MRYQYPQGPPPGQHNQAHGIPGQRLAGPPNAMHNGVPHVGVQQYNAPGQG